MRANPGWLFANRRNTPPRAGMAQRQRRWPLAARERRLVEAAEPSDPPGELRESLKQLLAPEVGPAYRCRIVLGVRCLPQQEIAEAHLATGTNNQVEIGQAGRIKVLINELLGHVLRQDALSQHAPNGARDLVARAIVEGHVQNQTGVGSGQF